MSPSRVTPATDVRRRRRHLPLAALSTVLLATSNAGAEPAERARPADVATPAAASPSPATPRAPGSPGGAAARLARAEAAYRAVDFEAQRREASLALTAGGASSAELVQIYRLLGIAHAALGDADAARGAFLRLLALDPEIELERLLSPRLRAPYMEARGYWDLESVRFGADVRPMEGGTAAEVQLRDPLRMVSRLRVLALGPPEHVLSELAPSERLTVRLEVGALPSGAERRLALLDAHGNTLLLRRLPEPPRTTNAAQHTAPAPRPDSSRRAPVSASTLWLGAAGLTALGTGAVAHVIREASAREWNGADCERAGYGTRMDQCASVDRARTAAERVAATAYAVGAASLATSVIIHWLTRPKDASPTTDTAGLRCTARLELLGVACATRW